MKIIVCGGGPSGLYFALLAKKRRPEAEVVVYEQNPRDAAYGFGIVLADRGLGRMKKADQESYDAIMAASFVSRHRVMIHRNEKIFIEGGGYGGAIARLRLLNILQDFCEREGVKINYNCHVADSDMLDGDLIVGADGVNSTIRQGHEKEFGTTSHLLSNKLAWYGTTCHFPYPLLSFKTTKRGIFWAAAYAYTEKMSTFVAECDGETWVKSGFDKMDDEQRRQASEEIFAEELKGHKLISNKSVWHSLPVTRNREWSVGNRVLIGDALHSAHPSIGSGTRIAMEDSIALIDALTAHDDIASGLAAFRRVREPAKQKLVQAAEKSIIWYENILPKCKDFSAIELVFDFMMRTGRIDQARLEMEYPRFMAHYANDWDKFTTPHP